MSGPQGQRGTGTLLPPIEIGSFVSLGPERSEFIGSASGIFFTNTVFKAFAEHPFHSPEPAGTGVPAADADHDVDPASTHSHLVAGDISNDQALDDDILLKYIASPNTQSEDVSSTFSYGINIPGLGAPPPPAVAKELLMMYFMKWHPYFPFLHGPTFFDQVDHFYDSGHEDARQSSRDKMCRAVLFQCIFNIGAINSADQLHLDPSSSISSPFILTSLLGVIASRQDISSLQTLLAVELYLVTRMSLRAASTVHGTLTSMLCQSGFHRCPFRYVQLPDGIRAIRQRIFWSAYVLDRHLSQALGHPVAINDVEVDVCIPGMVELHRPVTHRHKTSEPAPENEVRAHLPRDHDAPNQSRDATTCHSTTAAVDSLEMRSPAHHFKSSNEDASSYVLSYMATYSRLLGAALSLFHTSIHKRSITWDRVRNITSQIHSWWNSLPPVLQDDDSAGSASQYGVTFSVLYQNLILLVNRPFLSLPTQREEFRSSLQQALGASRSIVQQLRNRPTASFILAWPGTLSAIWMSGLVVAYASLLQRYPLEKGLLDLDQCLTLLKTMGSNWTSASYCHASLKLMLDKLKSKPARILIDSDPRPTLVAADQRGSHNEETSISERTQEPRSKRRKHNDAVVPPVPVEHGAISAEGSGQRISYGGVWQPVLEYTGPDFGFDAYQFDHQDAWQGFLAQGLTSESLSLLYDDAGWNSYVQSFGDRLS